MAQIYVDDIVFGATFSDLALNIYEEMKSEFDTMFWRSRVNLFICFYFYFFVCALAHMYSHVVWLSFEANYMA